MHMRNKTHQHLEEGGGGGRGGAQVGKMERKKERLSRRKRTSTRRRRQYREAAEHLYYRSQRTAQTPTHRLFQFSFPAGNQNWSLPPQNSARHTTIIPDPPSLHPFLLHPKKQQQQQQQNREQYAAADRRVETDLLQTGLAKTSRGARV